MNSASHVQWGWLFGHVKDYDRRERRMFMLASLAPDLDGIFFWNAALFHKVHHTFGHNIFFGVFVGAALAALTEKGKRIKWFILGYLLVSFHMFIDFITCPAYEIRFFWPISKTAYHFPEMFDVSKAVQDQLYFGLTYILQPIFIIFLVYITVVIYMKHRRTFFELISTKLDKFITDFMVLPFKHKCEVAECNNRAHYTCAETGSIRCIKHCKINRDLTISCQNDTSPEQ